MSYLAKAIHKLKPGAEFSFSDDDYSTIKWDLLEGKAPSIAEIQNTIEQIKSEEAAEKESRATAKALAQAKLEALGLTLEDLKALGL